MSDIIKLLPDSVANQIAAGEVIQRPASVVKELVENSIDAGATSISILLKDAGRTLIQISDNGCGMSPTDARMAFERHATSKISEAKDLFSIRSMGFRGEALASIAAIAEVKLLSKRIEDELGTCIEIAASRVSTQEPENCINGSTIQVRNLFFNTPARRKFLKTDSTEIKHVITEFFRVVLTHPEIGFTLHHNNIQIHDLPKSNFRQRICNVFGKNINQYLVPLNADTSIVKISGLIGKPETAKKSTGEQYFFVNQRFIRHPFLHKAVMKAYEHLLPSDAIPSYFIYFETDPESIDINIHPAKTEIKFEDEQSIFQILVASLKESLGRSNITPSIDFNVDTSVEIPVLRNTDEIRMPVINVNPYYNPFDQPSSNKDNYRYENGKAAIPDNWEALYKEHTINQLDPEVIDQTLPGDNHGKISSFTFQLKNKYIITNVKSGLMLIDQKRAHERILFERFISIINNSHGITQKSLFPQKVDFTLNEISCLMEIFDDIRDLGFEIEFVSDTQIVINGCPADIDLPDPERVLHNIIASFTNETLDIETGRKERIAKEMAIAGAVPYGTVLMPEEMKDLVDHLFACETPNYSPSGKLIISILNLEEIERRF
jgi:DNA mismatch repair protein MutL